MICESGRIVSIEDDWVWVETLRTTACQSCSAKVGCGQGVINSAFAGKRHYVKVSASGLQQRIQLHDEVEIAIPEHAMLLGSAWLYIVPLLLLIAGALVGNYFAIDKSSDLYPILGAVVGFLLAMLLVRGHSYLHRADPAYQPVLHRVLSSSSVNDVRPIVFS